MENDDDIFFFFLWNLSVWKLDSIVSERRGPADHWLFEMSAICKVTFS